MLCEEIKAFIEKLAKEASVIIDQKIRQKFGSKWIVEEGMKKRINMKLDHILNYQIKFKSNYKTGLLEIDISGGHLAGSTEALAKTGLIEIIDKRPLATGCWEYDFVDVFTKEKITKTEFHVSWNEQTILKNSWEIFDNAFISEYPVEGGKVGKFGVIDEKELTVVIKKHEKDINITTSAPYKVKEVS